MPERPDFALLILEPPQQKLELSATNKYSWAGATEEQERALYRATWRLFQSGLGEALCGVLREKSHPHLLPYIGGNVPLNYYLKHNFKAPAPIPSNDLDIKVEFGDYMRSLLTERGGGPSTGDKESWSEEEKAQFQACFDESLAMFVTYAKELMEALKAAAEAVIGQITSELKPLGIGIGTQAVHVYHKTHAAPRDGKPPLHLVPLSGGVFQLMCELTPPAGAEPFIWNLVDLEADWKSAKVDGKAFPTVTVPVKAPAPAPAHSPSPSPSLALAQSLIRAPTRSRRTRPTRSVAFACSIPMSCARTWRSSARKSRSRGAPISASTGIGQQAPMPPRHPRGCRPSRPTVAGLDLFRTFGHTRALARRGAVRVPLACVSGVSI